MEALCLYGAGFVSADDGFQRGDGVLKDCANHNQTVGMRRLQKSLKYKPDVYSSRAFRSTISQRMVSKSGSFPKSFGRYLFMTKIKFDFPSKIPYTVYVIFRPILPGVCLYRLESRFPPVDPFVFLLEFKQPGVKP